MSVLLQYVLAPDTSVSCIATGVLLVIVMGRLDLTVASGTMNGVLFYANVVKASSDALISNSVSKYFMIPSAWLNLDLGIETCFFSHLDMFWKVLLQFAFPLYIWLLVAGIILLSRYSTVAARLSGSNSVPVLATLFLLSYAKVLAAIIDAFSFTSLEAEMPGGPRAKIGPVKRHENHDFWVSARTVMSCDSCRFSKQ